MGGNTKEAAKRRQAKEAMKAKARKAKAMPKKTPPPVAKPSLLDALKVDTDTFTDDQLVFWICHGINFLVSGYEAGTWTPMFEGIYAPGNPVPTRESITQAIIDKYNDHPDSWPQEGKAALAWAMSERKIVFMYYMESMRRLTAAFGGDADIEGMAKSPHNVLVWALFSYLKDKIMAHARTHKHG
jgi:hypothetical protein